jgi:enoyl-CoA hydratase/carnithine racemase
MLEITDHDRIREIRLDRPPANAMDPALVKVLAENLISAGESADAVVISGRAGMFSAGFDIPALLPLDRQHIDQFWRGFLQLLRILANMPVPTAFALTGHAPAGGIVLSLFGDYRIMCGGNYKTGLNEVQVGLVVAPVIKNALVRLVGPHPAEKILVPGIMLSADQALDIGLVDELEENPETTVKRAIAWCESMLDLPRDAMLLTRQLSREDLCAFFTEADPYRVETFVDMWFSDSTQATLRSLVNRLQKK